MKKFRRGMLVSMVLMLVMLSIAACGGGSSQQANTSPNSSQPAANDGQKTGEKQTANGDGKVVNIGWSGPLSGGAALYGKNTVSGLEMAIKEINDNGGFQVGGETYKLNLITLDDKYQPSETGINAKRLVQENKTPIVYTPHSGGVFALQEFNEQDNFIVAAYTSEPQVTERGNKLTVRIPPPYSYYQEPFSKYAMEKFGKKVALIPGTHAYAKAWTELFKPVWEKLGGQIVAENPMDYNKDTDFSAGVSKSLAANPDVLFVGGASEPTALVIKTARELGFKGGFIVMDQAKMDEMAAVLGGFEMLEGAIGVTPLVNYEGQATKQFVEKYKQIYGKNPGSEAGYHYLTTYMFVEAMKAAGTVSDPKAIMAKMSDGIKNIPADKLVYPVTNIDEKGGLNGDITVSAVENGQVKIIPLN